MMINRRLRQGRHNLHIFVAFFLLFLTIGLFLQTLLFLPSSLTTRSSDDETDPDDDDNNNNNNNEQRQRRQQCHLPNNLNPFDPTIMPYVFQVPPLKCPLTAAAAAAANNNNNNEDGVLRLEQDPETDQLRLLSSSSSCRYRKVARGQDDYSIEYSNTYYPITENPFRNWPNDAEFIQVDCFNKAATSVIYSDIFTHIVPAASPPPPPPPPPYNDQKWSVLILGIDSISRLNFIRSLPKSLKRLQHRHGAVIFKGYNKLGENTFPNLGALLTGRRIELLPGERLVGLPHLGANGETFDDWPFIWRDYKRAGYVTMYSEDMPRIGTFHWQKNGFAKQPTDHYGRTLFVAMEKLRPFDSILNPILQLFESKNIHLTASPSLCFQGRKKHQIFWQYSVKQFIRAYRKQHQPFFALTWLGEPSHDHVNLISICDDDLSQLIDWLVKEIDDHTFVFVMSDHGARFDNIRNTLIGRIEDRMPFFGVLVPSAFKSKYPQLYANLRGNAERLTTPLDFHQTMQHILHLSSAISNSSSSSSFPRLIAGDNPERWSASFLAEILPQTRTCWQANIPEHYCACYRETPVEKPNDDASIREAARFLVEHINNYAFNQTQGSKCAKWHLDTVESASRVGVTKSVINDVQLSLFGNWLQPGRQIRGGSSNSVLDYVIVIRVQPSGALFEAHIVKEEKRAELPPQSSDLRKANHWEIIGEIQRINAYGNSSWCVNGSATAKKFCYCIN